MNKSEAGKLGGLANLRNNGRSHMKKIGSRGGRSTWQRYRLVPVDVNLFAMVHRKTGVVVAIRSG